MGDEVCRIDGSSYYVLYCWIGISPFDCLASCFMLRFAFMESYDATLWYDYVFTPTDKCLHGARKLFYVKHSIPRTPMHFPFQNSIAMLDILSSSHSLGKCISAASFICRIFVFDSLVLSSSL